MLNSSQTILMTFRDFLSFYNFFTVIDRRHSHDFVSHWNRTSCVSFLSHLHTNSMFSAGCLSHLSHLGWLSRGPHLASLSNLSWELELSGTLMTPWMYESHPHICTHACHQFSVQVYFYGVTHCVSAVIDSTGSDLMQLHKFLHMLCMYAYAYKETHIVLRCFSCFKDKADVILSIYQQILWKDQNQQLTFLSNKYCRCCHILIELIQFAELHCCPKAIKTIYKSHSVALGWHLISIMKTASVVEFYHP